VAARTLHLEMFDVQLQGALALARGKIVEMQTVRARRWPRRQPSPGTRARAPVST
jgi:hypothetical protein